jgi:WD40 repeat protein
VHSRNNANLSVSLLLLAAFATAASAQTAPAARLEPRVIEAHKTVVTAAAFLPDGKTAISASADATLKLWDLASGALVRSFSGHKGTVTAVAVSPGGKTVLSGSVDRTLRLWDVATGESVRVFSQHFEDIRAVALTPDGKTAVSGDRGGVINVWEVATGNKLRTFEAGRDRSEVQAIAFLPNGRFFLTNGHGDELAALELASGKIMLAKDAHTSGVRSIAISGRMALSSSGGPEIILWDLVGLKEVRRFNLHEGYSGGAIAISPDGRTALSGSPSFAAKTVKWFELGTGKVLRALAGHARGNVDIAMVTSVAFSPDGQSALSSGNDGTVRVWSLR